MALCLENVRFSYGSATRRAGAASPVLDGASVRVEPGRVTALIGPNGAGKSTALLLLAGLRTPQAGRVMLHDAAFSSLAAPARAARVAWVPQRSAPVFAYRVRDAIALGRAARGADAAAGDTATDRAAAALGLEALLDRPVTELSIGQQQRVALARALCQLGLPEAEGERPREGHVPRYLLADEPTSALDPAHVASVLGLFRAQARSGVGVVLALHDLAQAAAVADDVIAIHNALASAPACPSEALQPERLAALYGTSFAVPTRPVPQPTLGPQHPYTSHPSDAPQ